MKKFLIFIAILSFLGLTGWGGYYYWQGTPRYSLYQMGKALQNHDSQTFFRYVDIDKIVDGLAQMTSQKVENKFPSQPGAPLSQNRNSPSKQDMVRSLMPQIIKALKPILKKQLVKIVEDVERGKEVSPLSLCVVSHIDQKDNRAHVTITTPEKQTVRFAMEKASSRLWKVVRIDTDLLDLLQKPKKRER